MTPLYNQEDLQKSKSRDKLPLKCEVCLNTFYKMKKVILEKKSNNSFCSLKCAGINQRCRLDVQCKNCGSNFKRTKFQISKSKTGNCFCSKTCSSKYNNTHKTKGTRRSKLEVWLETKLKALYPSKKILFNDKTTINSELDIYFPDINIAFELNGIFHYEPIYGNEKLNQIQSNDNRKFQACLEKQIELCIIDTSKLVYFKEQSANKYLDIIVSILNQKWR